MLSDWPRKVVIRLNIYKTDNSPHSIWPSLLVLLLTRCLFSPPPPLLHLPGCTCCDVSREFLHWFLLIFACGASLVFLRNRWRLFVSIFSLCSTFFAADTYPNNLPRRQLIFFRWYALFSDFLIEFFVSLAKVRRPRIDLIQRVRNILLQLT